MRSQIIVVLCVFKNLQTIAYLSIALQLIVGLSILNVWLVQSQKPTRWRGGKATTITEEFQVYGLPAWSVYVIGALKVGLAILLIAGIWFPSLRLPAAAGLAFLLAGSVLMHLKVSDPLVNAAARFITRRTDFCGYAAA